jgi:hypothetical protein
MHRQEEQRRLAAGESPEAQDTAKPSPTCSSSPPIALSRPNGPSCRPPPLVLSTLPSSTERQIHALDLQFQPQVVHYSGPNIPGGMVSAPAHITSFAHQLQPPQIFPNWAESPHPTTESFPTETLQTLPVDTPTFVTVPGSAGWLAPSDLTWPSPQFQNGPPSSTGFEDFGSIMSFDAPLHSAQFDGGFFPAVQEEDPHFYLEQNQSWSSVNLPQLSPSDSHHEQSIVSESLPMTPASFVPEPFQTTDEFSEQLFCINSGIHREISSASPALYESLSPIDYAQIPTRPSSTQPSSFTRKRDIKIPHLSIENSAMIMGNGKLRPPQSAGLRTPRSPLHPIRDDSRRVSKASVHARPSIPNTPC